MTIPECSCHGCLHELISRHVPDLLSPPLTVVPDVPAARRAGARSGDLPTKRAA